VIDLEEIRRAREVIAGFALRTPLVRLDVDADAEIWLKLEVLQPVRSFKVRGAGNAILQASDADLALGVVTASAGNMAQGVCRAAALRGVTATIVVPEHAPQSKLDAIARYGGRVIPLPHDEWWNVLVSGRFDGAAGVFVHPVDDDRVIAGNGTIGLEVVEDLPDVDAVVVPWGGGGLFTGIATAVKGLRPRVRCYVAEPATAAPVTAARAAGRPVDVDYTPSFVDGAGARSLVPRVWGLAEPLVDGSFAVPLEDVAAAVRVLAERTRVIAEGAGALAPAVALSGALPGRKIVCVVSGGNIDLAVLARILADEFPSR
jgi:threonine dehydratase